MKTKMMKVVAVIVLTVMMGAATAQDGKPCKRIEKLQGWMKDSLSLTVSQAGQITAISDSACARLQRIKDANPGGKEAKKGKVKQIMQSTREEYKKVLNKTQLQKLTLHLKEGRKNKEMNPDKRLEKMTQKMKLNLGLTDDQTDRVKAANLELMSRMKAVKEKKDSGADKAELKGTVKLIQNEYDTKIKSILNAEQLAKWEKMKAKKKEKHKEKKVKIKQNK